ncbi:4Fe-4S dicluster domain-containing protein [Chloroflexota bacterium]
MGHILEVNHQHRLLQQKLDRTLTGAPDSPVFMKILKLLFTDDEAELARKIPGQMTSIEKLSQKLGMDSDRLGNKMTEMAQRGLIFDLERNGQRYVALPPVVIGFFEFVFMRVRDDMPMKELARLFEEYFNDSRFAESAFRGHTQMFRSLVQEEALPAGDHIEILDWERASNIVKSASSQAVGICQCHHTAAHLGNACEKDQMVCLSLNYAAESLIKSGIAQPINTARAMEILEACKLAGLAQTGDNVQRKVAFICNCCGCCCHIMKGIKTFNIRNAIVSSNWIMQVDLSRCKGCGECAKACPVEVIDIKKEILDNKEWRWAVHHEDLCLGCGACYNSCKFGALKLVHRGKSVITPETAFDRVVSMALERGKLGDLIFDDHDKLSHRALGRITGILETAPPVKALLAVKPLRSVFLNRLVSTAKARSGDITQIIE